MMVQSNLLWIALLGVLVWAVIRGFNRRPNGFGSDRTDIHRTIQGYFLSGAGVMISYRVFSNPRKCLLQNKTRRSHPFQEGETAILSSQGSLSRSICGTKGEMRSNWAARYPMGWKKYGEQRE
jgi:hypothetical protein